MHIVHRDRSNRRTGRRHALGTTRLPVLSATCVLLVLHGVAHFAGVTPTLHHIGEGTSAALLGGWVHVGNHVWLRLFAVVWTVLGVSMLSAAALLWLRSVWARRVLRWVAAASLVASVLWLWASVAGVLVDVAVLLLVHRNPPELFTADDGATP